MRRLLGIALLLSVSALLLPVLSCGGGGKKNVTTPPQDTTPPQLVSVTVTPPTATAMVGVNTAFTAAGRYSDASTRDVTAEVKWASADETVVWLNNSSGRSGIGTARGAGSSSVTATLSGIKGSSIVTVTALTPRFGYVTAPGDGTLSSYVLNPSDGSMRMKDYSYLGIRAPMNAVMHPGGKFLYFIDPLTSTVLAYRVATASGDLSAITGSPFACADCGQVFTIDPSGQFLYAVNGPKGSVSGFSIDAGTGVLTAIASSPFAVSGNTSDVAAEPGGHYLYVTDSSSNTVTALAIGAGGSLSKVIGSPFATGKAPRRLAVDATGQYVYVLNYEDNSISGFTIKASSGALTAISGSPFSAGVKPGALAFAPGGQYLYVANQGDNANDYAGTVSGFQVNSETGALAAMAASPKVGSMPSAIHVDPAGKLLYVVNQKSSDVWSFTIDHQSGALTPQRTMRSRVGPASIAIASGQTVASLKPAFAYAAGASSTKFGAYSVDATSGALAELSGSPYSTAGASISVATHPTGKFLYVANYWNYRISAYAIASGTGALTEVAGSPFVYPSVNAGPYMIAVDPSGRFIYMTNSYDQIAGMVIDPQTGALSPTAWQPVKISDSTPWGPAGLAVDPSGRFLYVADSSKNSISAYQINVMDGALTEAPQSPVLLSAPMGNYPQTIQVDATGGFAYVGLRCAYWASSCGSSSLYGFSIDVEDGRLEALQGSPWGTPFPDVMSMTLDARGRYIYIVDGGWSNIATATGTSGFAINSLTGNLVPMTRSFPFQPAVTAFLEPDPTGSFLYGGNLNANQVEVYGIDTASGALSVKQTLPYTAGGSPWSIDFTWKWE